MKTLKVEETSRAASVIGCNNDLLSEILMYLPARTILRLKLVSKQWMFLISDRQFAIKYSRNTHSWAPCGLFVCDLRLSKMFSIPLFGNPPSSVPPLSFQNELPVCIDSCKGLLLCSFSRREPHFVICNPTTKDFKVIPRPPDLGINDFLHGLTLVFNPLVSHNYKVIGIKKLREASSPSTRIKCKLLIYSSETNCWEFGCTIDWVEFHLFHKGVFSNGTVYWEGDNHMHYYNDNSKEFGNLDMPTLIPNLKRRSIYFGESCGHLYLVRAQNRYHHYHEYNIFEFDHSSLKWSDPHVEILDSKHFGSEYIPKSSSVLAVAKGEKDGDLELLFTTRRTLVIFNLVSQRQVESLLKTRTDYYHIYRAFEYIPSLAPI